MTSDSDLPDIPTLIDCKPEDLTPEERTPSSREERQAEVLRLIAAGAKDSEAALALGLSRHTVMRWKHVDPAFAAAHAEARRVTVDKLVAEAERRAMRGSDRLLEFLLCNFAPDKFSNKQRLEHTGANGGPVEMSDKQAAGTLAAILEAARQRKADAEAEGADLV